MASGESALMGWAWPIASMLGFLYTAPALCQPAARASLQEDTLVAAVDFVIGGHPADADYQFGEVRDLALFTDERFVVADIQARRVVLFSDRGRFITNIGGVGDGPGEFRNGPYSVTVGPDDEIWVEPGRRYHIYSSGSTGWSYDRTAGLGGGRNERGKPVFARDGTVAFRSLSLDYEHRVLVWMASGSVVREDTLPPPLPWDEMGYGEFFAWTGSGTEVRQELGPYHPKDLLRLGRTGGYAKVVTSQYKIDLYRDDGVRFNTIRRDFAGPGVSALERRREEHILDSLITYYRRLGSIYPEFEVPERKPPVRDLWFDEEDRLWVELSTEEADSVARAHVYAKTGEFLYSAVWPRDVSLSYGAIRGKAAIGIRTGALDVQEIVRMTFASRR